MIIDSLFMEFVHGLCMLFGFFLTPFLRLITLMGEKAWFFLLIALLLLLGKKTRWIGLTIIISIFIGFIVADVGLKPLIMRMRPYTASNVFQDYWVQAGSYLETDYSMPSGHTIGCAAFFISLLITCRKRYRKMVFILGIIFISLMILSRTYFMHHYLTDCLVGVLIAIITSLIAKLLAKFIHSFCKSNEDIGLFKFMLNFDLYSLKK